MDYDDGTSAYGEFSRNNGNKSGAFAFIDAEGTAQFEIYGRNTYEK
jgi:hypothetical protein